MKVYQLKSTKYSMPKNLYMETYYAIKSYPEIVMELEYALTNNSTTFGDPKSSDISNYPERYMLRHEEMIRKRDAIDEAISIIPEEYREAIIDNIFFGKPYPLYASRSTYSRWKHRFIYEVSNRLGIFS